MRPSKEASLAPIALSLPRTPIGGHRVLWHSPSLGLVSSSPTTAHHRASSILPLQSPEAFVLQIFVCVARHFGQCSPASRVPEWRAHHTAPIQNATHPPPFPQNNTAQALTGSFLLFLLLVCKDATY